MSWHIYYQDGSVFCDRDGSPEQAPLDGVLAIIDEPLGNRAIHQGGDYYCWLGESWASGSQADLDRWIRFDYVHPRRVKFGIWDNFSHYQSVVEKAIDDDCECE